jgi:NAD(P)-dependent dehydrogenase (short-subunit alcohol dehydrogenase family)
VSGRPVGVVTGGGGGIGAAVAEELGRQGWFVVTMDPLVSLDGTERLPEPEETTAGRIVAAGGEARATNVSVTDADAVREEVARLVEERGRLDAVVNVAGITRPTGFASGTEDDWRSVLSVHLDGYRNVLAAALPVMASAGRGRILGVTSGSGWRPADAGAYSCAKRAVASLTWQLGALAPDGVSVNAMSPIAVTRMVTAALARAAAGSGKATGGLSLGSMPQPEELGPLGAHLVSEELGWCRGQVVFVGGSEAAVVEPPRLLEVAPVDAVEVVVPGAFVPAEQAQASGGGSNPRFALDAAAGQVSAGGRSCVVVTDRADVGAALAARLGSCRIVGADATVDDLGDADAVVLALGGMPSASGVHGWERVLAEHDGIAERIHADARWARAVADLGRPVRLVTLTDATTAGGRSRAQAAAQLARAGRGATGDRVTAFAVAVEGTTIEAGCALAAHLVSTDDVALAGAELVAGDGWVGLRSHPRPGGSVVLGGTAIPPWFDATLRQLVGAR